MSFEFYLPEYVHFPFVIYDSESLTEYMHDIDLEGTLKKRHIINTGNLTFEYLQVAVL